MFLLYPFIGLAFILGVLLVVCAPFLIALIWASVHVATVIAFMFWLGFAILSLLGLLGATLAEG